MGQFAIMITETFEKNPNTKTTFNKIETEEREIEEKQYNNVVNSSPFFRRLGGSETAQREYTCRGYKIVKLISMSPDRKTKVVRHFKFID